jgi:hypothetical protein
LSFSHPPPLPPSSNGITKRRFFTWTTGAHATDHPYFNNGSALFEDPDWVNAAMMSMIEEEEASAVITLVRLQVSTASHAMRSCPWMLVWSLCWPISLFPSR